MESATQSGDTSKDTTDYNTSSDESEKRRAYLAGGWIKHYDGPLQETDDDSLRYTDPWHKPCTSDRDEEPTVETRAQFSRRIQENTLPYVAKLGYILAGALTDEELESSAAEGRRPEVRIEIDTHGGVCQQLSRYFGREHVPKNGERNTYVLSTSVKDSESGQGGLEITLEPRYWGDTVLPRNHLFADDSMMPEAWRGHDDLETQWKRLTRRHKTVYANSSDGSEIGIGSQSSCT